MNHLILSKEKELKIILNDFFAKGYSRNSIPKCHSCYQEDVYFLACKIYKRGFSQYESKMDFTKELKNVFILDENDFKKILDKLNYKKIFFIVDSHFYLSYSKLVSASYCFQFMATESSKNIENVIHILNKIPQECEEIFALGGGITLDLSGFIAGLCELPVTYVATTLLASVDAAIGGKTGVNYSSYGKNQLGLFYESKAFYCVPEYLRSLPQIEIVSGLCEALKHSWLYGSFESEMEIFEEILRGSFQRNNIAFLIEKNIHYKKNLVAQDPFETRDIRSALNFGHTLAHIIESLVEEKQIKRIPHGIAVAHGITFLIQNKYIESPSVLFSSFLNKIIFLYPIKRYAQIRESDVKKYLIQDKKNTNLVLCTLSLPTFGHFSLKDKICLHMPITHTFPIQDIAVLCTKFLNQY